MPYKQLSEKEWEAKKAELADMYLQINECQKCGHPVISGYCCVYCGDNNPSERARGNREK